MEPNTEPKLEVGMHEIKVVKLKGKLFFQAAKLDDCDVFFKTISAVTFGNQNTFSIWRNHDMAAEVYVSTFGTHGSVECFVGLGNLVKNTEMDSRITRLSADQLEEGDELRFTKSNYDWILIVVRNSFQAKLIFQAVDTKYRGQGKTRVELDTLGWKEISKRNRGKKFIAITYPKVKVLKE